MPNVSSEYMPRLPPSSAALGGVSPTSETAAYAVAAWKEHSTTGSGALTGHGVEPPR